MHVCFVVWIAVVVLPTRSHAHTSESTRPKTPLDINSRHSCFAMPITIRYKLLRKIGTGKFGTITLVRHVRSGKTLG